MPTTLLKVSKFQNEFMKSSFLQIINLFWNLMTFTGPPDFLTFLWPFRIFWPRLEKEPSPKVEWLCIYFLRLIEKISLLISIRNKFISVPELLHIDFVWLEELVY